MVNVDSGFNVAQNPHPNQNLLTDNKESPHVQYVTTSFAYIKGINSSRNYSLTFLHCYTRSGGYGTNPDNLVIDAMSALYLSEFFNEYVGRADYNDTGNLCE